MGDLSWLTEAANQKIAAQAREFVELPLYQQAQKSFSELSTPITPQAEGLFKLIEEHRRRNPVYIPFKPGTPTLQQKQLSENIRQWQAAFEESKRRYEDEQKWRERNIQLALQRQAAASGGTGSIPGITGLKTEGERRSFAIGSLMQRYQARLDALWEKEGVKGAKGYVKGPKAESVANELAKIEAELIKNLPVIMAQNIGPSDIRNMFNALIINGLGANGKEIYQQLKQEYNVTFDLESVLEALESKGYFSTQ